MSLASSLVALSDGSLPHSFEGLKSQLPLEWIESCLANSGTATVRKRKLTCEQVIWLVVGMGLYRDRSIPEIVQRLDLVLPAADGSRQGVAKSAITPARDRVGAEPLRDLFQMTGQRWALPSAQRNAWRGLQVFGVDGTTLRVPDSIENRQEFESFSGSAYPLVRMAVLLALRGRIALGCSFGGSRVSETALAKDLLPLIPEKSLTIFDRYFHNYSIWHEISSSKQGRHWLVRGRDDLQTWTVIERYGPGDELVEIRPTAVTLANNPQLPKVLRVRVIRYRKAGFKTRILITSLLDPKEYPASEIANLYHERWELELAYDEIKTEALERREALRSQSPNRVRQELWGLLIAYNLVRREMEGAAEELDVSPNRISFRTALVLVRDLFMWAEVASPGKLPKMLQDMRIDLKQLVLPPRRKRTYERCVKTRSRKYPIKEASRLK